MGLNEKVLEVQGLLDKVNETLSKQKTLLDENAASINKYSSGLKATPSEFLKAQKEATENAKKLETEQQKAIKTSKQMEAQSIKESNARNALNKQREQSIKSAQKEAEAIEKANNVYNKIQAKVNGMIPTYNNLQSKQLLGIKLSAKEEAQLKLLETRLNKYQNVLKTTDIAIGKHQREVGNYAKANSNLSASIGQISRELPNFGQSFQVGVMSLTNNVGALLDGIKQVRAQNDALKAEGKPTVSALSQVTSALFSWQTGLFVGIGILSAYSKEIADWVEQLFEGEKQLNLTTDAQLRMNKAQFDAKVQYQKESQAYTELLKIAANGQLPYEKRKAAIEELKSIYPSFLKNLTDEQIIKMKGSQLEKELFKAVGAKAKFEENKKVIDQSKEKLVLIEQEIEYKKTIQDLEQKIKAGTRETGREGSIVVISNAAKKAQEELDKLKETEEQRNKVINDEAITGASLNQLYKEQSSLTKQINDSDQTQIKLKEKSILLDDKEDKKTKQKRERLALSFKEVESEYALKVAILERQKAEISDVMNNDSSSLNTKLQARIEYSKKSIELLNLETEKEKAVYALKYAEDLEKNNLALRNKDISYQKYLENITDINNRFQNEIQKADVETSQKWNEIITEDAKYFKKIEDEKRGYTEKTDKLILEWQSKKFKKIADDEKNTLKIRQRAFEEYLALQRKQLDIDKIRELANSKSDEETENIRKRYKQANDDLNEMNEKESPYVKAREQFEKYLSSLSSGQIEKALNNIGLASAKMFVDFDKNGESTFMKMWDLAETTQEKLTIAFQAAGDVFQEVMGIMNQMSEQNTEAQINRLERQKDISIAFAGDSASARAQIEKQYQAERQKIEEKQFKSKQQLAIANIAIDTAQAIMAAWTDPGYPGAIALTVVLGALGAAQIAMVSSQKYAGYWKGTDNAPEGLAYTDEKGAEIHTDKYGNIKDLGSNKGARLKYLSAGDKIYTAEKSKSLLSFGSDLSKILSSNNIDYAPVIVKNDNAELISEIKDLKDVISNKPTSNVHIDKKGIHGYLTSKGSTTEFLNNRVSLKGRNI